MSDAASPNGQTPHLQMPPALVPHVEAMWKALPDGVKTDRTFYAPEDSLELFAALLDRLMARGHVTVEAAAGALCEVLQTEPWYDYYADAAAQ
jgi:hypothetical protein